MEKHTSLLLITYFYGLSFGVATALSAMLSVSTTALSADCLQTSCQLLFIPSKNLTFFIITGAVLGLGTVLLSRGLYRLFFIEKH